MKTSSTTKPACRTSTLRRKWIPATSSVTNGCAKTSRFSRNGIGTSRDRTRLLSRFTVNVPPGWRAAGVTFNHAKVEPVVSGNSYTWQLQDMGPVEREPSSPRLHSIVPWLAVSLVPAAGGRTGLARGFENDLDRKSVV